MKNKYLWMLVAILSCSLMTTGFSSCISDNVDNASSGSRDLDYDISNVVLIDSGYISTLDIYKDIVKDHDDQETDEDCTYYEWGNEQLESFENQSKAGTRNEAVVIGESGETTLGVKYVSIRYKTTGADGSEKELSELIAYSKYANDKENKKKLKNLIIGCHCTITSDKERPTNFKKLDFTTDVNMLTLIGSSESSLVVIPDYEGYGITSKDPHPYCNRDVTAKQMIDGAKAAVVWFEKNIAQLEPDWKTVAVGYSQGGAVAAGILNYYNAKKLTGHTETVYQGRSPLHASSLRTAAQGYGRYQQGDESAGLHLQRLCDRQVLRHRHLRLATGQGLYHRRYPGQTAQPLCQIWR